MGSCLGKDAALSKWAVYGNFWLSQLCHLWLENQMQASHCSHKLAVLNAPLFSNSAHPEYSLSTARGYAYFWHPHSSAYLLCVLFDSCNVLKVLSSLPANALASKDESFLPFSVKRRLLALQADAEDLTRRNRKEVHIPPGQTSPSL